MGRFKTIHALAAAALLALVLLLVPQSWVDAASGRISDLRGSTTEAGGRAMLDVNIRAAADGSVASIGGGTQFAEDLGHTTGDVGTQILAKRCDTAASSSGTDGDYTVPCVDSSGRLYTNATISNGATTDTMDASVVGGQATAALVIGGHYQHDGTNFRPVFADPCRTGTKVFVPIDIVTATTTEVIDASANNYARICFVDLHTNAANNVALVEDDTDACASPTAGMAGGVTSGEGWNFGANGGRVMGNGDSSVLKTAAVNRNVCLITSAATQLSGVIVYAYATY